MSRAALFLLCAVAAACNPRKADWGLAAISKLSTPPDPPLACGAQPPPNPTAGQRAACAFGPGTSPAATLGVDATVLGSLPIRHVIIMMKENRSFDQLFGRLHDRGQPGVDPIPASYSNPTPAGRAVFPSHSPTTCVPFDPGHQSSSVATCIDHGKMDGFVINAAQTTSSDGTFVMGYYDQTDLPFYYWLASTFAVGDGAFAPMASGTFGNRSFLLFGSNVGVVDTGISFPSPATPSLMQLLMNAGYTWAAYTDGEPFSGTLDWLPTDPGVHRMQDLYDALDQGTLPNVAFVDGVEGVEDDHPTADLQRGEAWSKLIYDHAVRSPQWNRLAILFTYDEAGAFADHVAPGFACAPEPGSPFIQQGPRVPLVAISPWARRNYVSHVVRDHTSITRFVEALFDLPALSARDANADALLDMFDFSCGRDLSVAPAPDGGVGGC
jgi:phospholipase C